MIYVQIENSDVITLSVLWCMAESAQNPCPWWRYDGSPSRPQQMRENQTILIQCPESCSDANPFLWIGRGWHSRRLILIQYTVDLHGIYGENHGYTMCLHIWWVMSEVSIGWYSKPSNWCPTNAWPMDILQWLTWTKACPSSKKSMRAWKVQESWQNSWIVLNRFEPLWDLTVPGCGVGLGTNFSAHGLNACLLLKSGKQGRKFRKRRDLNAEARQNASHSFSLYLSHLLRLCHKFQLNCHVAAGFKTLVSSESLWVTQLQALEIGFFVGF